MTAIKKVQQDELIERAEQGLLLTGDIKKLTESLEADKAWFRDVAGEETLDVVVEGLGKVQVKKPSEGGTFTSTTFNLKAFEALDKKTQHLLISSGVVEIKTSSKAPSKAAVVFTLNV